MKIQLLASTTQLGKKLGTPSPHSRKYSSRMYHGTTQVEKPVLLRAPPWSRKIPLALAVKSLSGEGWHWSGSITSIISPLLLTGDASLISIHFQGFRLRSTPIHFQLNLKMSVCYYLPSFLFTHLSRVAWISWLPAETT